MAPGLIKQGMEFQGTVIPTLPHATPSTGISGRSSIYNRTVIPVIGKLRERSCPLNRGRLGRDSRAKVDQLARMS
jgi:hypothetical protein